MVGAKDIKRLKNSYLENMGIYTYNEDVEKDTNNANNMLFLWNNDSYASY